MSLPFDNMMMIFLRANLRRPSRFSTNCSARLSPGFDVQPRSSAQRLRVSRPNPFDCHFSLPNAQLNFPRIAVVVLVSLGSPTSLELRTLSIVLGSAYLRQHFGFNQFGRPFNSASPSLCFSSSTLCLNANSSPSLTCESFNIFSSLKSTSSSPSLTNRFYSPVLSRSRRSPRRQQGAAVRPRLRTTPSQYPV